MRNYSSTVTEKTLQGNVLVTDTQITLSDSTGFPSLPFTLVINPDTTIEEIITVNTDQTGVTAPTYKVTRGQDGTTAKAHTAGNAVRHQITARDLQEPQDHIIATTSVHGITDTSTLVTLTGTQTLTNKRLTSPKLNEDVAITATATELNYVDGVTSAIQTQIDTKMAKLYTIPAAKTGAYTFAAGDDANLTELNGTFSVTIPLDSTYSFSIGTTIDIVNVGTGVITVAATSGVTLNGTPGLKLRAQWSSASLIKRAANTWILVGDLAA